MERVTFLGTSAAALDPPVRGDPITGARYTCSNWAQREFEAVFVSAWHIGGMEHDLEQPGDFIAHALGAESVLMVRQGDGAVKAFYNVCQHRGNQLVAGEMGCVRRFTCAYHSWTYGLDGTLLTVQDAEDFPQGNPCGKANLAPLRCELWGGMVWFSMDPAAPPLRDWLGPIVDQLEPYRLPAMKRVIYLRAEVDCNWKIIRDNFNESYHLPTLHPELKTFIDDLYSDTVFEMYPGGHNRMVMKGCQPSGRYGLEQAPAAPLDDMLRFWELDPAAFQGQHDDIRKAVARQRRALGAKKGYWTFEHLSDSQLVDYYHYTLFPNTTFTMGPEGMQMLRSEPHPSGDPQKCIFDHWFIAPQIIGRPDIDGPAGSARWEIAPLQSGRHGDFSLGAIADQDLSICVGQQKGLRSRGFRGGYLSHQEKRVQRFHELLNDKMAALPR